MNRLTTLFVVTALTIGIAGCGDDSTEAGHLGAFEFPGLTHGPEGGGDIDIPRARLGVDASRSGTVDFDDPDDTAHRYNPASGYGALVLPNLDDDAEVCRLLSDDEEFEDCFDAATPGIVNDVDLEDMATIKTLPTGGVPESTRGVLYTDEGSEDAVELHIRTGDADGADAFESYTPGEDEIGPEQLADGVEFAIEANRLAGEEGWDGDIELTWEIETVLGLTSRDHAHMQVAPLLLRHHLHPAENVFATDLGSRNAEFAADLDTAVSAADIPGGLELLDTGDPWTRDFLLNGYVAIPGPDGPTTIEMFLRSANLNYPGSFEEIYDRLYELLERRFPPLLREAGQVVYTDFHGPGWAGEALYDGDKGFEPPELEDDVDIDDVIYYLYGESSEGEYPEVAAHIERIERADTLDSFGNTEVIPPHTAPDGTEYPHGRVLRGRGEDDEMRPDPTLSEVIDIQDEQPIVWIDTAWLAVAHVDETISFVESDSNRGWSLLYNDPVRARELLEEVRDDYGRPEATLFDDRYYGRSNPSCSWTSDGWDCPDSALATRTVQQVLDDTDVMAASARAAVEVDAQVEIIVDEIGLDDDELFPLPFLHHELGSGHTAYTPNVVNGLSLRPDAFATSTPHGPVIDGVDHFAADIESVLAPLGVDVHWVESWNVYHTGLGGVHCATNSTRQLPETDWWLKRRENR